MNSDVMHSRVQDGPLVHPPSGNNKNLNADTQNLKKADTRSGLERNLLEQLVTEVHETVAKDFNVPAPKQMAAFSTLHLWNLRRNTRSARNAMRQPRIVTGIGY